jgi:iron complex transport system ATP-binding protein
MKLCPGETVLSVRNLSVGYKQPVLTGVSFECCAGSFISILGSNGVGKTTLLRTISRHLRPMAGLVLVLGKALESYRATDLARIISVVMTDKAAPPLLQVLEFVGLGRHPHTGFLGKLTEHDLEIVTKSLEDVKAEHLATRFIDQLSDGERQKVSLARALAQEPKLMLLDEPTAHLDLKFRMEVMGILRSLCRLSNLTVLAAIHDVDVAAKVSDQVIALKNGKLLRYGPPHQVLTSKFVSHLYDFEKAGFSSILGGIEIRGDGQAGRAFIISERDKGAQAFRYLSKHGYTLSVGVLNHSDLDSYVAGALGAEVFSQDPSLNQVEPQDNPLFQKALDSLKTADLLVDAVTQSSTPLNTDLKQVNSIQPDIGLPDEDKSFPPPPKPRAINSHLLEEAKKLGVNIISLGPKGDISPLVLALETNPSLKLIAPDQINQVTLEKSAEGLSSEA